MNLQTNQLSIKFTSTQHDYTDYLKSKRRTFKIDD